MRRFVKWAGAAALAALFAAPAARAGDPEPVIEDVLEILKERGIVDDGQYTELVAKHQGWQAKNGPLLGRIEFSGDMRLRYENFWYDDDEFGFDEFGEVLTDGVVIESEVRGEFSDVDWYVGVRDVAEDVVPGRIAECARLFLE